MPSVNMQKPQILAIIGQGYVGLPLAIVVFVLDRRRDRQMDEEEIYSRLSDEYADFMRLW